MAFQSDEKTEAPTPRRRLEARNKGQVARSQDLPAAVLLFAGLWALYFLGTDLWNGLATIVRTALYAETASSTGDVLTLAVASAVETLWRVAPILLVLFAVGWAVQFSQVGPLLTAHPLMPTLAKISPLQGIKRLCSVRSVMLAVINVAKLIVVGILAWLIMADNAAAILYAFTLDYHEMFRLGATLVFDMGIRITTALLLLAFLDFAWQRHRHERDLRMTKEEVKDEMRSMEGDPKLKARRRQVQLQLALQRLRKEVPKADVVVTNPTHYAVAIQYDAESMPAPKVVAKGADYAALRIRALAAEHGIPVVERKPLARALFESVDEGQYIPERFYRAIAEILAFVYELTGRTPLSPRGEPVGAR